MEKKRLSKINLTKMSQKVLEDKQMHALLGGSGCSCLCNANPDYASYYGCKTAPGTSCS